MESAKPFTYSAWLLHSRHAGEGDDLFLFIQINSVSAAVYDKHSIELLLW